MYPYGVLDVLNGFIIVIIGLLAGFTGTLLGIGGGSIATPLLVVLGYDIKLVVPASLVAIMGTSAGGLHRLYEHGYVNVKIALLLEILSIAGAISGVFLAVNLPSRSLEKLLGVTLIIASIGVLVHKSEREVSPKSSVNKGTIQYFITAIIFLVAGFISSTAGIGGGIIKVPAMILVLGLPIKTAIATSKLMVGITALSGVLTYAFCRAIDLSLSILLLIGTYTGATISSRLFIKIPAKIVKYIAVTFYLIMSFVILARASFLL